jgi:hypothetical protein
MTGCKPRPKKSIEILTSDLHTRVRTLTHRAPFFSLFMSHFTQDGRPIKGKCVKIILYYLHISRHYENRIPNVLVFGICGVLPVRTGNVLINRKGSGIYFA